MSVTEIDSSKWTGISDSDQEGDDWLPEEIVPRLSRFRAYLHLASSIVAVVICSMLPLGIILFALDLELTRQFAPQYSKDDVTAEFGIIIFAASFVVFFYFFVLRYLRHIARYKRLGYLIKINRRGIFTKDTGRFFAWSDIHDVSVFSDKSVIRGGSITISRKTARRYNEPSIWIPVETHTWCLDGTDVDFYLLERSVKRWHELAQGKQHTEAQA